MSPSWSRSTQPYAPRCCCAGACVPRPPRGGLRTDRSVRMRAPGRVHRCTPVRRTPPVPQRTARDVLPVPCSLCKPGRREQVQPRPHLGARAEPRRRRPGRAEAPTTSAGPTRGSRPTRGRARPRGEGTATPRLCAAPLKRDASGSRSTGESYRRSLDVQRAPAGRRLSAEGASTQRRLNNEYRSRRSFVFRHQVVSATGSSFGRRPSALNNRGDVAGGGRPRGARRPLPLRRRSHRGSRRRCNKQRKRRRRRRRQFRRRGRRPAFDRSGCGLICSFFLGGGSGGGRRAAAA